MSAGQRIEMIINHYNLNPSSFSKAIGQSSNVAIHRIVNDEAFPSFATLLKIKEKFPELNVDWILNGDEEMIIDSTKDISWYAGQLKKAQEEVKWHRELVETLKIAVHNQTQVSEGTIEKREENTV